VGCDMCGKDTELFMAKIEGTTMKVCQNCAKYGTIIKNRPVQKIEVKKSFRHEDEDEPVEIIVQNYALLVRNGREQKGLTQEDAAKILNLKTSVLNNIERSKLKPSIKIARKLENFFKIRLVEEYVEEKSPGKTAKTEGFTFGDLIKNK